MQNARGLLSLGTMTLHFCFLILNLEKNQFKNADRPISSSTDADNADKPDRSGNLFKSSVDVRD